MKNFSLRDFVLVCFVVLVVGVLMNVKQSNAAVVNPPAPSVTEFTYKVSNGNIVHVNTWTKNGVQCSVVSNASTYADAPLSISCVNL
jgi:hypothetical protein